MPPELHLRPDRLHAHAGIASELVDELQCVLLSAPAVPVVDAERERLQGAVGVVVRELAELSVALRAAAAAGDAADADVFAAFTRLRDALDRP